MKIVRKLQIREDIKKGVYVENLKEVEVTSARDVMQQLIQVYKTSTHMLFIISTSNIWISIVLFSNIVFQLIE